MGSVAAAGASRSAGRRRSRWVCPWLALLLVLLLNACGSPPAANRLLPSSAPEEQEVMVERQDLRTPASAQPLQPANLLGPLGSPSAPPLGSGAAE